MGLLDTLLAKKREPPARLEQELSPCPLELYLRFYDKMVSVNTPIKWDDHEEVFKLLQFWLGLAEFSGEPDLRPHWSQINPQVFRLACFLNPPDTMYPVLDRCSLIIWTTYKKIKNS